MVELVIYTKVLAPSPNNNSNHVNIKTHKKIALGPLHSTCQILSHEYDIKQYGMAIAFSFPCQKHLKLEKKNKRVLALIYWAGQPQQVARTTSIF